MIPPMISPIFGSKPYSIVQAAFVGGPDRLHPPPATRRIGIPAPRG